MGAMMDMGRRCANWIRHYAIAVRQITAAEFAAELVAQGVPRDLYVLVCPLCQVPQTPSELIAAGAGADFNAVKRYFGFCCVGRWTGAPEPRAEPDGRPCTFSLSDWGGCMREVEVAFESGFYMPIFRAATPEEAREHVARLSGEAAP